MEDILTYVIVFGIIIAGVAIWQFRYAKPRPYWLSHQIYPNLQLWVMVQKKDGKHSNLLVKTEYLPNLEFTDFEAELINSKRDSISISLINDATTNHSVLSSGKNETSYQLDFSSFRNKLQRNDFKFKSFRIKITDKQNNTFKSHELAFNKNWTIYKPDTGNYN